MMKNSGTWRKTKGVLTVVKVAVQIAGMGMIIAADKALSWAKRKKVRSGNKKILK